MISDLSDLEPVSGYLTRIGAEVRSLRKAVVREVFGKYWKETDVIRFSKTGEVFCNNEDNMPTKEEEKEIKNAFGGSQWPEVQAISEIVGGPKMVMEANKKNRFVFRDSSGKIVMVQVRVESEGGKKYIPWTFWTDNKWRPIEPEGSLPIYNENRIRESATVFIHEGAKAARYAQWLVDGKTEEAKKALNEHPWGSEIRNAVHIGWVGGAMAHHRTNWKTLNEVGIKRAYIVADNDEEGKSAVKHISQKLRMLTFHLQFDDRFPQSFDIGDEFPEGLFFEISGGGRVYSGPGFSDCVYPATWATDKISTEKGRPVYILRSHFRSQWIWLQDLSRFVSIHDPGKLRDKENFNDMMKSFSDARNTADLILREYRGTYSTLCYRPDEPDKVMIQNKGESSINIYQKPTIKPIEGDIAPFIEFMNYMITNKEERHQTLRWVATMIGRPDTRMRYGLLLVSEAQGIGKSTLGMNILKPLVGHSNTSLPSEGDIIHPDFNSWISGKRLAVVNEIYHGHSWKAYNKLKTIMADDEISINEKFKIPYTIENCIQIFACSNSIQCLKIEKDDRRWLFPEMAEVPWRQDRFEGFFKWLNLGGRNIILHWAQNFDDHVTSTERAPMTKRKHQAIIDSQSQSSQNIADLVEGMNDMDRPFAVSMRDIYGWLETQTKDRIYETDYQIRKIMMHSGAHQFDRRIKIGGRPQYVIMNCDLSSIVNEMKEEEDQRAIIRSYLGSASDVIPIDM